jgi:lipopolysaccharide biosynthesis protein
VQRRLNESLPPTPRLVAGDLDAVLGADRVAVLAEYSLGGRLRPEALRGAAAWADAGVPTLIVAARDAWSPKTLQVDPLPDGVAVVRRPNVGYDFGSWGAALTAYPQIAAKSLVVLTNDSLAGPYAPLDELVARIVASPADVWAATSNVHPQVHLQSYLLAFRGGVLAREPLRDFFANVRAQETKRDVVRTYEFGLSDLLQRHAMTTDVGWTKEALGVSPGTDSVYGAWSRMLAGGFPFVKRTVLEDPRFADQRDAVAVVVRQEYGVDLGSA